MIDFVDYVIAHKECDFEQDDTYRILTVGGFQKDCCLSERTGENIHQYNSRINECTGLYWIWKNTSSEYVGLSHYRRWFYNCRYRHDHSRLDADRVEELLRDREIILTGTHWFPWLVIDNMRIALGEELTDRADHVFRELIAERKPYFFDAYLDVMFGSRMHICNMFVTRRPVLNAYCEWLFSFLLDAADRIQVDGLSTKQQRVAGYFAEAMWTVWLRKQDIRICEQPHRMIWG